jgi:sortase A
MPNFGVTTAPPAPGSDRQIPYGPPLSGHGDEDPFVPQSEPSRSDVHNYDDYYDDEPARRGRLPDLPYLKMTAMSVFGVGLLIVLFVVYLFAFTPLSASRNQQRLAQTLAGQTIGVFKLTTGRAPANGQPLGILSIPTLHLQQVVVEGTTAADLMNGPGLMPLTALPGAPGNSVIAARRVTFGAPFGALDTLQAGDRIRMVDGLGTFNYRVVRTLQVAAGQHDVVVPTQQNRLTLVTSNGGFAPNGRLVVEAKLVGPPWAGPSPRVAIPHDELGLSGDSAAGGLAVVWSLLTLIVLVGAVVAVWRWRRPALIYVFAAPVVVACGLLACESVARALPATF